MRGGERHHRLRSPPLTFRKLAHHPRGSSRCAVAMQLAAPPPPSHVTARHSQALKKTKARPHAREPKRCGTLAPHRTTMFLLKLVFLFYFNMHHYGPLVHYTLCHTARLLPSSLAPSPPLPLLAMELTRACVRCRGLISSSATTLTGEESESIKRSSATARVAALLCFPFHPTVTRQQTNPRTHTHTNTYTIRFAFTQILVICARVLPCSWSCARVCPSCLLPHIASQKARRRTSVTQSRATAQHT